MPMAKVLAKGQIVIPKEIREKANIHTVDKVDVQMTSKGIMWSSPDFLDTRLS